MLTEGLSPCECGAIAVDKFVNIPRGLIYDIIR